MFKSVLKHDGIIKGSSKNAETPKYGKKETVANEYTVHNGRRI